MRRDRQLAKKKKARARAGARGTETISLHEASRAPFGPAFMSMEWRSEELPPALVTVVITRQLPNGLYLPFTMLVDRTCVGMKNAFLAKPLRSTELQRFVEKIGMAHEGVEEVDLITAQSVVFAALDYAAALGFRPHRDFDPAFVGPRPDLLEETPLARRSRPFYCPGPYEDESRIIAVLRTAVGNGGFDAAMFDEEDELDDVDDVDSFIDDAPVNDTEEEHISAPDERDLLGAIEAWLAVAESDPRIDVVRSIHAYVHAVLGEEPRGREVSEEHLTSLPLFWAAFFRPCADGRTGLDLARAHRSMKRHAQALARLSKTRARLFEVLALDGTRQRAMCRDVLDGAILSVRLGPIAMKVTRWMRFFGYLTPMSDGTFYAPSTLFGNAHLRNVDREEIAPRLNELLSELKVGDRVDAKNLFDGLTRFAALAHGLLCRMAVPTREEKEEAARPMYVVNSDGDRFELHEAELHAPPPVSRALLQALAGADDFVDDGGNEFGWTKAEAGTLVLQGERLGSIEKQTDGSFRVVANSTSRYERLLTRLSGLAKAPLTASRLKIMRPWETNVRAVAEETVESRRVVCAAAPIAIPRSDPAAALLENVVTQARQSLDEHVPLLGGRPRDLVADADGRTRVERWLADWEVRGLPHPTGGHFLDLDVLRRDLGLPGIADGLST